MKFILRIVSKLTDRLVGCLDMPRGISAASSDLKVEESRTRLLTEYRSALPFDGAHNPPMLSCFASGGEHYREFSLFVGEATSADLAS